MLSLTSNQYKTFLDQFNFTKNPRADILSGLTVALALVPEAIAFAFVAHVEPLVGLYAAFFVGLITSIFGGRSGMISGATGATAVAMVGLVIIHGPEYLFATMLLTGSIQIAAGFLKFGKFIKLVPYPVMLGFVNGLAIVIFLAQLGQFKSAQSGSLSEPIDAGESHSALNVIFNGCWMSGIELTTMISLTLLTMGIIWVLPKIPAIRKIGPAPLISIVLISGVAILLNLDTRNVGDLASVAGGMPQFHIPSVPWNLETLFIILPFALTIAGIGLIESLLTLTLVDEITESEGKPNLECVGQGLANFVCGFFKAMGGCAMIGQTMINMDSGGRGRLSGFTAALALLLFIVFLSSMIDMIPIAALTGIMMMVVIGTFAWPSLKLLLRIPKEDAAVILIVTGVTVVQDLAVAVVIGVIVSCLVYSWQSSKQIRITESDSSNETGKSYALHGTLFFGSIWTFKSLIHPRNYSEKNIILDLSDAKIADHSALEAINAQTAKYQESGKNLQLTNLTEDSLKILRRAEKVTHINVV